ncbi:MAG: hypothetical protein AAF438_23255, partial [Pseudomonadota bacterium]
MDRTKRAGVRARIGSIGWAMMLGLIIGFASLSACAAVEFYHSPHDDGARAEGPIPPGVQTLHLYVDGGSTPSPAAPCDVEGTGDEVCAYLV